MQKNLLLLDDQLCFAVASAHRAVCIAGESAGAWNGRPRSTAVNVTGAPKGACTCTCRSSAG